MPVVDTDDLWQRYLGGALIAAGLSDLIAEVHRLRKRRDENTGLQAAYEDVCKQRHAVEEKLAEAERNWRRDVDALEAENARLRVLILEHGRAYPK